MLSIAASFIEVNAVPTDDRHHGHTTVAGSPTLP